MDEIKQNSISNLPYALGKPTWNVFRTIIFEKLPNIEHDVPVITIFDTRLFNNIEDVLQKIVKVNPQAENLVSLEIINFIEKSFSDLLSQVYDKPVSFFGYGNGLNIRGFSIKPPPFDMAAVKEISDSYKKGQNVKSKVSSLGEAMTSWLVIEKDIKEALNSSKFARSMVKFLEEKFQI